MDSKAQSKTTDSKETIAKIKATAAKAEKTAETKAADGVKAIETKADSVKKIAQAKTEEVKETAKEVVKAAAEKTEEVVKAVEEKAAEVKAPAKKTAEKKTAPKTAKTPAKKAAAKPKKPVQTTLVVEYQGRQIEEKDIVAAVKKVWTQSGNKVGEIKTMELYVKPEDSAVYFVINGSETGKAAI